ncbi:hypothetical protein KDL01_39485 [Actinospica durhamensis]|uniref:Uncharacterized protein n=1 Tax=Actinospica durhamensis TaxID=1508375 RepID=A0A941F0N8_9ACTN|nr:hypothetical protein [Actinospica durhamensis]MBR7839409.1 hypothetical protein [Actinospica durhamensis]
MLLRNRSGMYGELVELAHRDPVLSKLFPHSGHTFVLLADEFSSQAAATPVFFVTDGLYRIYRRRNDASRERDTADEVEQEVEFEGDARATIEYLSRQLGPNRASDTHS